VERTTRTAEARLELEVESEVPAGRLTTGNGEVQEFRGWIELAAVIEDWRQTLGGAE
jgi:hypothetical protein